MVQNQYLEFLLETGVVGFGLFCLLLIGLFYVTRRHKYLWPIFVALLVQWWFFSGYPNTLHLFIIFIGGYLVALKTRPTRR